MIDKDTHTNNLLLFRKPIKKTLKLSVLGSERWVTDREVVPECA
jgi:hypothetical protein